MRTLLRSIALFGIGFSLTIASSSFAKTSYDDGYTGKQGKTCDDCHGGGTKPTLTLSGPTSLTPGATGNYTATLSGGPDIKTFGAAVSTGSIAPVGGNMKQAGSEVFSTHDKVATATFQFTIKAPASGAITLYYMGLASNGSGTGGDGNTNLTKTIAVSASASPDAGTTNMSDAGMGEGDAGESIPSEDGGSLSEPPKSNTTDDIGDTSSTNPTTADEETSNGAKKGDGVLPESSSEGCSIAHTSKMSSIAATPLMVALALFLRRKRKADHK